MRRIIGLILAGLGAFFVAFALLLRFYLPGQLVKYPIDEYRTATLHADNASYFSAAQLRVMTPVSVTATYTVRGDVAASSGSTAVWDSFTAVRDDTNSVDFNYIYLRGPFDRRNGELTNCCGSTLTNGGVNLPAPVHLAGQGYVLPFGAQKQTYPFFDTTLGRPEPAAFAGTATLDGLQTYRYVERVAPTHAGSQTLPGSLVGLPSQPSVTLPEYYQSVNTYWIDPVTGGPVSFEQNETLTLRDSSGATRLVLFQADLKFTPQSTQTWVNDDVKSKNKVTAVTSTGPLVLLLAGLVLLAAGIALSALYRRGPKEPVADEQGYQPQEDQGLAPH